jgi:hypothetical protein
VRFPIDTQSAKLARLLDDCRGGSVFAQHGLTPEQLLARQCRLFRLRLDASQLSTTPSLRQTAPLALFSRSA